MFDVGVFCSLGLLSFGAAVVCYCCLVFGARCCLLIVDVVLHCVLLFVVRCCVLFVGSCVLRFVVAVWCALCVIVVC